MTDGEDRDPINVHSHNNLDACRRMTITLPLTDDLECHTLNSVVGIFSSAPRQAIA